MEVTSRVPVTKVSLTAMKIATTTFSNQCLNKGKYPKQWKLSQATPIFEEGDKANMFKKINIGITNAVLKSEFNILRVTKNPYL